MKKALIIICLLGLIGGAHGDEWNDTKYPENESTTTDITETFIFPYDLDKIDIQSMEVEIEAKEVNTGNDYDETVWIYNSSDEIEYLGDIPYGVSYKKFIINNPTHYAYNNPNPEIYLKFNATSKVKNITVIFYNINGSSYYESYTKKSTCAVYFPWSPENTSKIEIIVKKRFGGDCVFVDNDYTGILNEGDGITTFTIDEKNATSYLNDSSITVYIDKSDDGTSDSLEVSSITVKVYYTNKSSNMTNTSTNGSNSGSGGNNGTTTIKTTSTSIPKGAILMTLISIPIVALIYSSRAPFPRKKR